MKVLLISLFLTACASKSIHKVTMKEDHYKSPRGGSVDAEIRVDEDKTKKIHPQSSLTKLSLKPGAVIPEHTHTSDEYLHFTKGNGEMIIAGEKVKIKNDTTVFIPKGVKHSYVNNTKFLTKAIQVYTPAGPEQRFKKWKDAEY